VSIVFSIDISQYAAELWPFGDAACKFAQYFLYVAAYGTIYTLVAISALRYATVVGGNGTAPYRTKRNAVILAAAIWFGAASANVPTLLAFKVKTLGNSTYTYCGQIIYSYVGGGGGASHHMTYGEVFYRLHG